MKDSHVLSTRHHGVLSCNILHLLCTNLYATEQVAVPDSPNDKILWSITYAI